MEGGFSGIGLVGMVDWEQEEAVVGARLSIAKFRFYLFNFFFCLRSTQKRVKKNKGPGREKIYKGVK